MAVAKSNSNQLSTHPCNCYRISSSIDTILDTDQIAHLENRYRLGEQLGWGQFGVIRACLDKLTGEILACKSIAKERLVTLDDLQSVKLEIEIMTRLSGHPNIVDLKAVYEDEDYVHLVMELCAGGELFHRLEKNGRYSESEAKVLFRDLMQVVVYCHDNGVVHRDLKPENILLATKASSSPIKLADFGLATYIKPGKSLHGTVGSPFYIAPEVLAGGYNQAADVWSAGVILYILLSGMPPFWGKTKSKIFNAVRASDLQFPSDPWDHLSETSKDLITKMLCTDPAQRLTASEVLDHSWMEDCVQLADESFEHEGMICGYKGLGSESFSTTFISRNQDISFGAESPIDVQPGHSPTFTCRSSFSSFLVDAPTPCPASRGFSFSSCGEQNNLELSSPIPSMPSFAFSGPCSLEEQVNPLTLTVVDDSPAFVVQREGSLGKLFRPADLTICLQGEESETERKSVVIRKFGGTTGSRAVGTHSRRNHTIGLGELEQLDLMVSESIIRWASCTLVSSASSLRSSLVC